MMALLQSCFQWLRAEGYRCQRPLVLVNGLAEQSASWFCNRAYWSRHFDLKVPELLIYDGPVLQKRIADGLPITVDYLTDQLEQYLDAFVQKPPYHFVASSLGCQVLIHYAVRHPRCVDRLVLLAPSGFGGEERLPVVEGVRAGDHEAMLSAIFYNHRRLSPGLVRHYGRQVLNKAWKKGILRTVRGTFDNSVVDKLPQIRSHTLVICGAEDRIVSTGQVQESIKHLPLFHRVVIPRCGHAPQIEKPRLVNRLVKRFLLDELPRPRKAPQPARPALQPQPSFA
jgi:abhydrolase domain-containing protein 6